MDDQRTQLRFASWLELFPWLILFRCPGLALRIEILALAAVGGLLTSLAWWGVGWAFYFGDPADAIPAITAADVTPAEVIQGRRFASLHQDLSKWPGAPTPVDAYSDTLDGARSRLNQPFASFVWGAMIGNRAAGGDEPFHHAWLHLTRPFVELFSLHASARQFAYLIFGGLATLLIWSVIGGAITRTAALQLAREERIGLRAALKFALSKLLAYFAAPLFPFAGVALFVGIVFLFVGLPMNLDAGLIWSGAVWILVLLSATVVGVLLLGLLFGWPLMWATISTEGTDSFDAISRSYAYALQRPLHYVFYVLVVVVLGSLSWLLVLGFGEAVIQVSWWAADWGVFDEARMDAIVLATAENADPPGELQAGCAGFNSAADIGITLFSLANGLIRAIAYSFAYGYFWVAISGIYLLLRREVDHTETDEVFLDDDSESYGLPPLDEEAAQETENHEGSSASESEK